MNKVEVSLIDSLNRMNFMFKNEDISTECIKNFKGFSLFGEKFGPFEKDKKYRLKLFLAMPFIQDNILKVDAFKKCDHIDVQRYAIAERDEQRISKRDELFFLNKIKEFKVFMEKDVKDRVKTKTDLDKFNSYNANIIDSRLLKILRMSKSKLSVEDEQKLSNTEKILYNQINKIILTWRNFFLGITG